jgi:nicotinate-nucleotide adenylyltransferase
MKKIGLYGGSFNPCHIAHLNSALIYSKYCDEVWISPCANHTFNKNLIDPTHRIKLLNLLLNNKFNNLKIDTTEIDLNHKNGSYDLLNILSYLHPDKEFLLCIGEDCANEICKWKNFENLIKDYKFIVLSRNDFSEKETCWYKSNNNIYINKKIEPISSTFVRNILKEYYTIKDSSIMKKESDYYKDILVKCLTEPVLEYIIKNNLFSM